jgi:diguanylate cyclase
MYENSIKPDARGYTPAPIPDNEGERLAALRNMAVLDTPKSESCDVVTRLAAQALQVPIVLVSLVDENRQWFKSRVGLDADQTPRDVSFCAYAVYHQEPLLVPDALRDPRFAGNPLVVGPPHIRAYLGIPLFSRAGLPVGTLCAIDRRTRAFGEQEVATLQGFARITEEYLHSQELTQQAQRALQYAAERDSLFKDTFEQAAVGIVHMSVSGHLLRINQRMCDLLGYTEAELRAKSYVDITYADDLADSLGKFQKLTAGEIERYRDEQRFITKRGELIWGQVSVALRRHGNGQPDYTISVIEDITEKKNIEADLLRTRDSLQQQVELQTKKLQNTNAALQTQVRQALDAARALSKAEGRLRAITDNVPAIIGYWNAEMRCETANVAYGKLYGLPPAKMVGMSLLQLQGEKLYRLNEPHARAALGGQAQHFERTFTLASGKQAYYDTRYLPDTDEAGGVRGFFVLQTNITDLRLAQMALEVSNAKLHDESVTDYLTGLRNRRVFSERSELAAKSFRSGGRGYALILSDLDNFKHVNDQYGHDSGDEVLRTVGKILKNNLRRDVDDVAARLGGEEFAILCTGGFDRDSLLKLSERIRAQINEASVDTPKGPMRFSGSFGVAMSMPEDADWKTVYARADAALYEAKQSGKNRVVFGKSYDPGSTGRLRALRITPTR